MRPLSCALALSFAAVTWTPLEVAASETPEKDTRPPAQPGKLLSAPPLKPISVETKLPHQAAMMKTPANEAIRSPSLGVGAGLSMMQVGDRHALGYHYASGSSLMLTNHSHHLGIGWRTRF